MSYQPAAPPNGDEAKRKIDNFDLSEVLRQAVRKHPEWTPQQAQQGEHFYRDFLWLYWNHLYNQGPQVDYLTPEADEVWHYHVLNTRKYHADCDELFGGQYLHHTPLTNPQPNPTAENAARQVYQRLCNDDPAQLVHQCMWN